MFLIGVACVFNNNFVVKGLAKNIHGEEEAEESSVH